MAAFAYCANKGFVVQLPCYEQKNTQVYNNDLTVC